MQARLAWQKEMVAKAAADAAAKAEQEAKAAEEKKKKEEIAEASKKAKEAAEKSAEEKMKKAKEEHETALKKAEKAKEEAEKKQKDLEAVAESLKPPDHAGKMIKFTDAIDRKFEPKNTGLLEANKVLESWKALGLAGDAARMFTNYIGCAKGY